MATFFKFNKNQINVVCGDLNVSLMKMMFGLISNYKNVVSHTKIEREKLIKL